MSHEEVLDLGLPQFHDRVIDVGEITSMTNGQGKGRIARDPERIKAAINRRGIRPPKRIEA